jgi:hypothetical protein
MTTFEQNKEELKKYIDLSGLSKNRIKKLIKRH